MSQILKIGEGAVPLSTLTGDIGGAISPTAGDILIVGGPNINISGTLGPGTLTVNLDPNIVVTTAQAEFVRIDGGAGVDAPLFFDVATVAKFVAGVDESDSENFKISVGSSLGTNDTFIMTSDGERTMPLQPAFSAGLIADRLNVTGNNTTYTIVFGREFYDQGGDWDNVSTFTASVTGKYQINYCAMAFDLGVGHGTYDHRIVTSNRTYLYNQINSLGGDDSAEFSQSSSVLSDMDAADTAFVTVRMRGGAQTVDIGSSVATDPRTLLSIFLAV